MRLRSLFAAAGLLLLFALQPAAVSFSEEEEPFNIAVAAYESRDLDRALMYAKRAVQKRPTHVDGLALLGELYYMKQDLYEARKAWDKALQLDPSREDVRSRVERLKKETPLEKNLARSDTYPFVVRFAEGQMPVDLGELKQLLRDTYRSVGQQFDYFPDHPITVILYSEEVFGQVRGASHQAAGLYDGKIRLPIPARKQGYVYSISASLELKRVLWHEYAHAVVHDITRGRCPVWLNEGLATLEEARVYQGQLNEFRGAYDAGRLYAWSSFWDQPYDQNQLKLQYQQAYMVAGYLVKRWGWSQMRSLLKRLGQGSPIEEALRAEYRMEPSAIEKDWLSWLKRNL